MVDGEQREKWQVKTKGRGVGERVRECKRECIPSPSRPKPLLFTSCRSSSSHK